MLKCRFNNFYLTHSLYIYIYINSDREIFGPIFMLCVYMFLRTCQYLGR